MINSNTDKDKQHLVSYLDDLENNLSRQLHQLNNVTQKMQGVLSALEKVSERRQQQQKNL
ncbi:hypothetical protein SAMN05421831_105104 [Allopseudospirillum japonicum]|uniref:Uncharacterized protein n=1 Tax=Allopseudospirillum japonicum TaxID=64971 RepID=A0A1H6SBK1_9GAMM|nr:hypothetical protein [Allopseudospirillum japonicum]SEI60792.1 hypothetical protein SAMN05421831_105104 [Allopseudospirillum japonicum]